MKSRSIGAEVAEDATALTLAAAAAVEVAVVLGDAALAAAGYGGVAAAGMEAVAAVELGDSFCAGAGVASGCGPELAGVDGAGGGASSSSSKESEVLSARSGSTAEGAGRFAGAAAAGAIGSVSKSSRESCSNGSSGTSGANVAASVAAAASAPADAAATRATSAAIAPVFPVLEADEEGGVASSVGKPNRSAASSRLSSAAGAAVADVEVGDAAGLDQRPELDTAALVALPLDVCASGVGDAVAADVEAVAGDGGTGVGADAPGAGPADAELADAELVDAELADAELVDAELADAEPADAELAGAAGRGGGFAAGGGAAAGAGRAGGTVGIASFEVGLLAADGRAAVLDAAGGNGRLAVDALLDDVEVGCAVEVDDCVPAGDMADEAGLAAAGRALDVALDVVDELGWRVLDGADARAADCVTPVAEALVAPDTAAGDEPVDAEPEAVEPGAVELRGAEPVDSVPALPAAAERVASDAELAVAELALEPPVVARGVLPALPADLLEAVPALVDARDCDDELDEVVPSAVLAGGSSGSDIHESESGVSSVGCAHVPERAVDFAVAALEPLSGEALAESDVADRGEDVGVVLLPAAGELDDVAFARVGLDPDSDVVVEALRSADPDDEAVLPLPAAGALGVGPLAGGMPNPAGEAGLPAEADDEPAPAGAAFPGEEAEDALSRTDLGAATADAPGRGVATCDAAPDDEGAEAPLPAESVSTGSSGSNN